jgi:hypothetical protein
LEGNRGESGSERTASAEFDVARSPAGFFSATSKVVEQDGLTYAAKTPQGEALLCATRRESLYQHLESATLLLTPCEFGRSSSGTGRIRVPDKVHDPSLELYIRVCQVVIHTYQGLDFRRLIRRLGAVAAGSPASIPAAPLFLLQPA